MILKASYILASAATIGLMFFEAPRGGFLTSSPERGKVERKARATTNPGGNATVRMPMFVFLGGYQGGK